MTATRRPLLALVSISVLLLPSECCAHSGLVERTVICGLIVLCLATIPAAVIKRFRLRNAWAGRTAGLNALVVKLVFIEILIIPIALICGAFVGLIANSGPMPGGPFPSEVGIGLWIFVATLLVQMILASFPNAVLFKKENESSWIALAKVRNWSHAWRMGALAPIIALPLGILVSIPELMYERNVVRPAAEDAMARLRALQPQESPKIIIQKSSPKVQRHRSVPGTPQADGATASGETQGLIKACAKGNVKEAERLLADKADVNMKVGPTRATLLIVAAEEGQEQIAQLLLEKGANIDAQDSLGWTALMKAVLAGHIGVAKLLLDQGAAVNAKLTAGWTALDLVSKGNAQEMRELLLKHGAVPHDRIKMIE